MDFGIFNTRLIVTDAWGCTDSIQKAVNVYEPPIAHFNWSDTSCTAGLVYFVDSSYHVQGHIQDFARVGGKQKIIAPPLNTPLHMQANVSTP